MRTFITRRKYDIQMSRQSLIVDITRRLIQPHCGPREVAAIWKAPQLWTLQKPKTHLLDE